MRVGAVGVDADIGPVLPDQAFALHGVAEELDHGELGELAGRAGGGTQSAADLAPGLLQNDVDGALGGLVAGDLLLVEDGFELADQVGGADDLLAQAAQELDRAGVHHGDVHDGVVGRVLHGDARVAVEHYFQARGQLLPA